MLPIRVFTVLTIAGITLTPVAATATATTTEQSAGPQNGRAVPAGSIQTGAKHSPVLFIQNVGQFDTQARFQVRGTQGAVWLTDNALWLTKVQETSGTEGTQGTCPTEMLRNHPVSLSPCPFVSLSSKGVNLRLTLVGMNPAAHFTALEPQATKINFLTGSDASVWRSNVPTYGAVRWEEVYPGINLVLRGSEQGLGLTVEAQPDADLSVIRLRVEGAEQLAVNRDGLLTAQTAVGPVRLPALLTANGQPYQATAAGDAVTFGSARLVQSVTRQSQNAPAEDPSDLVYSTFLGGAGNDDGYAMAVGTDGSAYVTGHTSSLTYPVTPGAFDTTFNGPHIGDTFVTKFNPSANALSYSTYLGGSGLDVGFAITVDSAGSAYIAGATWSRDFPTTTGAYDRTCGTDGICNRLPMSYTTFSDVYVTKLNTTGSDLVFSTYLGGSSEESSKAIAVAADGSVYVAGQTASSDYPTTTGAFDTGYSGGSADAFVTKLAADGRSLVYSTFLGGSNTTSPSGDVAYGLAQSGDGTVYVTGGTDSSDFPVTLGAYRIRFGGGSEDAFITHINAAGDGLIYSTFLGGGNSDRSQAIAIDSSGSAYVTGFTASSATFPTTVNAYDRTFNGVKDAFVAKLHPDGSSLDYSTFLGGTNEDYAQGIVVDASGAAYVSGYTRPYDFPITPGAYDTTYNRGVWDVFVSKFSADGSILLYSTYIGGEKVDYGYGMALDPSGLVDIAGHTHSLEYPTTPNAYSTTCGGCTGNGDVFLSKLSTTDQVMHVQSIAPSAQPEGDRYRVGVVLTIHDANGLAVPNATVSMNVTWPDGHFDPATLVTDNRGLASTSLRVGQPGTYTFTVTNISKPGSIYDPVSNVETTDSITIP